MKYTNTLNLPALFVTAVQADTYSRGNSDISVTELIGPPRKRVLTLRHDDEIVEDVADRVWSLHGQVAHGILERAAGWQHASSALDEIKGIADDYDFTVQDRLDAIRSVIAAHRVDDTQDIVERRLFADVLGWRVSGQVDMLREGGKLGWGIVDWKSTSVWTWIYGGRVEWEHQLNLYAFLVRENGMPAPEWLRIYPLFRDWSHNEAQRDPGRYPQRAVMAVDIPLWDEARARAYAVARVALHQRAMDTPSHELPECTASDRWAKAPAYAVMKKGRKTALRVLPTYEAAEHWMATKGVDNKPDHEIVYRPGESVRCARYCPVAGFCSQRQAELLTVTKEADDNGDGC